MIRKKSTFKVSFYLFIDSVAIIFLFLLFLPLLIDTCSLLFTNKTTNLFYLAKDFPIFFNYTKNTNIWFNGLIAGACFLYLVFLIYFNVYFARLIFNMDKREESFVSYLLWITIGFTIVLLMTIWSIVNVVYYMRADNTPIILLILTLIPGVDILTLFYWIPQLLFHFWNVIYLALNLFWSILAFVGLGYAFYGFWKLLVEGFQLTDNNSNQLTNENTNNIENYSQDALLLETNSQEYTYFEKPKIIKNQVVSNAKLPILWLSNNVLHQFRSSPNKFWVELPNTQERHYVVVSAKSIIPSKYNHDLGLLINKDYDYEIFDIYWKHSNNIDVRFYKTKNIINGIKLHSLLKNNI